MSDRILVEGESAWRLVEAERLRFVVDAAGYLSAFHAAAGAARAQILVLGWDVDSRLRLLRDEGRHDLPTRLGPFLDALVKRREALEVYLLAWDPAFIYALERELLQEARLGWFTDGRFHFHFDDVHPVGASHHQKVVVVDDRVAFTGGIDLAAHRWDTRAHRPDDPRREAPSGARYAPFHDLQVAVSGEAARAFGDLARDRWRRATEEALSPPEAEGDPWPAGLEPDLEGVRVALVRTDPAQEAYETRAALTRAIASARRHVYAESQYLTSRAIRDAIAERLADPDGPEVVLVLPRTPAGWLEERTMGVLFGRALERLREADRHGRLRIVHPVAGDGTPVYVHAKLLEVDGRFAYVGSANLSNRSMGLDTEVGVALETDDPEVAGALDRLRDGLLAEHLGVAREEVTTGREAGSLVRTIDALGGAPPTLRPIEDGVEGEPLLPVELVDPEGPIDAERLLDAVGLHDLIDPGRLGRLLERRPRGDPTTRGEEG